MFTSVFSLEKEEEKGREGGKGERERRNMSVEKGQKYYKAGINSWNHDKLVYGYTTQHFR